jgi:hypothetical protein
MYHDRRRIIMLSVKEELSKAIDLQDELGNPLIVMCKNRAKEKITIFDSNTAVFDIVNNEVLFDFWEIEGFSIKLDKIKSVITEVIDNMTTVYLKLKYGNTVMLHFMSN